LETSATRQLNTDDDGTFTIKKGKLESNAPTGDEIFRSINTEGANSSFVKRVQHVLIENTRYNGDNPLIKNGNSIDENTIKVATVSYPDLGVYGPKKYPTPTQNITDDNRVSIREMKRLGLLTLLGASGDVLPNLPANKNIDAWFAEVVSATSIVPGSARLGVKLPVSRFDANQLMKTMNPNFVRPTNVQMLDGKTNYTFGNANTPFTPFAGINSVSSITTATILIATVAGLLTTFAQIKYKRKPLQNHSKNTPETRHSFLGSSTGTAHDSYDFPLLDLPKTKHEFFACLDEGIKTFFGLDAGQNVNATVLQSVAQSSEMILNAHGYFNTILRQIVRGTSDLIGQTGAAIGVGQNSTFEPKADEIFNQFDPGAVLERLKGQAIVKFINILVTIGDRMIDRKGAIPEGSSVEDTISLIDSIGGEFLEDNLTIDPSILIAKNKLKNFNNRSTMSVRNMRSLLSMPENFANSANALGNKDSANPLKAQIALNLNNKIVIQNRIDTETVKEFEDYLEKDYMPFYFHDLRTNDILSFHAFVGDLNESLDAEYTETEGYGRIGTVPIYKNTKRSISFSFYIVSTGEEDFDEMWYKVNRLAMMLFPQWSEGRQINFAGNKFIQPFSQIPAASPLIRLRIGDLWKTNYSKFTIARLFGLSTDINQFKIGGMTNVQSNINEQAIRDRAAKILQRRNLGAYQEGEVIKINRSAIGNSRNLFKVIDSAATPPANQLQTRRNPNTFGSLNTGEGNLSLQFDYSTTDWLIPTDDTELRIQRIVNGTQNSESINTYLIATVSNVAGSRIRQIISGRQNTSQGPVGESFVIPLDVVKNDADIIRAQAISEIQQQTTTTANDNSNEQQNSNIVQDFFNETGNNANPIIKAFKSTEGRGIAGFIKKMTPTYEQSTWETEKFGGRAPQFLKLQIDFLPIWDVNPGLDYNGAMTAPIWNVGRIMNNYHGGTGLTESAKNNFQTAKQKLTRFKAT
jgi:hypothetical protein